MTEDPRSTGRDLFYGVEHFSELQAHLDIPPAVLAVRLQKLALLGIVRRAPQLGGRGTYSLTERGVELWPATHALAQWGERQFAPGAGVRRVMSHALCGSDLLHSGRCESCEELPGPADVAVRNGPGADPTLRDDRVSVALRAGPHRLLTPLFGSPHGTSSDGTS